MPSIIEWVEYFYPFMMDGTDTRYIPEADLLMAITVAADYRPACLTTDRQDQAQAHYAAYVAEFRRKLLEEGQITEMTETVSGPIVEKREGDTMVKYATSPGVAVSSAALKAKLTGPGTPYAAWQALWELCVAPVVEGDRPVRRGAIITAFG